MKEVRFGLIGLGAMGMAHAKTLLGDVPNARLCAAATASRMHAAELLALPGAEDVRVFATPAEMYQSGLIDAVLIATPQGCTSGRPSRPSARGCTFCWKSRRAFHAGGAPAERRGDKSGRAFGAMFNQRTNPAYRKMKRLVESGELGEIRRTNVVITDWLRAQSYYDSCAWRATWAEDGGGVLLNQAPHNLDLWQWICGMPLRIRAFCGFGRWHDIEVEDDVTAYVEYPNGATGTFITCTGEAPGTNRFEISLTGGQLVYENNRLTLARPDTPVDRFIREYAGGFGKPNVTMEDITPDEPYPMHAGVIRAFADHILTGAPMIADGREGLCSLMLANAMLLSSWMDETIELPLDDALRRPSGRAGRPKPEKDREADQAGRQQIVLTAASLFTRSTTRNIHLWQAKLKKQTSCVFWIRRKSSIRRISIRPIRASTQFPSPTRSGRIRRRSSKRWSRRARAARFTFS